MNLILYFCFYSPTSACGHTDETPRGEGRRAVEMHRPLFYSSSAGHPRVAQRKRICKHSCLSNRCLHARSHTQAHARLNSGQKLANNEPSFSDVEPIRSKVDRQPKGFYVTVAIYSHLQRHTNTFLAPVISSSYPLSSFCPASSLHQSSLSLYSPLFLIN